MEINPYNIATGSMGSYTREGTLGFNPDIDTAEETVWSEGGLYSYLSSATVLTISSSSANDVSAGTGARTIEIEGLGGDLQPISEIVTLNGQTGVATTKSFLRVFRLTVKTAGSGDQNAGVIYAGTGTLIAGVPANVYAAAPAGQNQSSMCIWTVPGGKSAYMTGAFVSTQKNASNTATIRVVARPPSEVFQTKGEFIISQSGGPIYAPFTIPLPFRSGTDIEIRATASANNTDVTAAMLFMVGP